MRVGKSGCVSGREAAERKTGTNAGSGAFVLFQVYNDTHTLVTHTHTPHKERHIRARTARECKKRQKATARAENPNLFHSIAMEALLLLHPLLHLALILSLLLSLFFCVLLAGLPLFLHFHFYVCTRPLLQKRNDFRKIFRLRLKALIKHDMQIKFILINMPSLGAGRRTDGQRQRGTGGRGQRERAISSRICIRIRSQDCRN